MIGARLILLLLWPVLWLAGSVHVQGATARLAPGISSESQVYLASPQSSASLDFHGGHGLAVARVHRRADFRAVLTGPLAARSVFQAEVPGRESLVEFRAGSEALPGLAKGWQFLWRTALSPRAPSLVS